jgi:hypothetical protein
MANYVTDRLTALEAEILQLDEVLARSQANLQRLTSRRLMLQGALVELQELAKRQTADNGTQPAAAMKEAT